jgi:glycosyltransferase involved in cell wall biosynthesis
MDSVCAQTFSNLEILCIDDGSKDGSGAYLDRMAETESRVRVIHFTENQGVPSARNRAMDEARGEWIYFMDSDDWIDPDYIEALVHHALKTGLDIVSNANFIYEYDDPSKSKPAEMEFVLPDQDAYYDPHVLQRGLFPVVWLRLYRRSFLLENDVRFPLLRGGVEDNYFVSLTDLLQEKGYIFHGPAYHYYQRTGSLVRTPGNSFHLIQNARLFYDELVSRGIPTKGVRLVHILPDIAFNSEEEYQFARNFFVDVRDAIRNDETSYPRIVPIFMEVILACRDLASYNERFKPNFCVSYIREHRKALLKS